jgi:hypothetical protein
MMGEQMLTNFHIGPAIAPSKALLTTAARLRQSATAKFGSQADPAARSIDSVRAVRASKTTLDFKRPTPILLATLCFTAALSGSPQGVALATDAPSVASPSPLPEIGRTRSSSRQCVTMHDLVIPSWAAAQRADVRFTETQTHLSRYAEIAADETEHNSISREAGLSRLSTDAAFLLQATLVMKKVLDDPRLSPTSKDPQIQLQRTPLENLYAAQRLRADLLNEFVLRESTSLGIQQVGMEDSGGLVGKRGPRAKSTDAHPISPKVPPATAPPGMPVLTGLIPIADRAQLADWGNATAVAVRNIENHAAQSFLPMARDCRDASR